jgi:hypothetical protein
VRLTIFPRTSAEQHLVLVFSHAELRELLEQPNGTELYVRNTGYGDLVLQVEPKLLEGERRAAGQIEE